MRAQFLLGGALVVLVLWVVWLTRARWQAPETLLPEQGTLQVPGLIAPLHILRDSRGIPHVFAENTEDAFFGLGFVHAQDRLEQMTWLLRLARGRTAEWVGAAGLDSDRSARTLGFGVLADSGLQALPADLRAVLNAYTAGVNARSERVLNSKEGLPRALAERGGALEPWSPADSLAVLKFYAWSLDADLERPLILLDLIRQLGPFDARPFFPPGVDPKRDDPSLDPPRQASRSLKPSSLFAAQMGLFGGSAGSNAWVVAGALSHSGKPLLVADHHHAPTAPPLFHQVRVRGGGLDVAGASIPGIPVVWTGRNERVAWAAVRSGLVLADLRMESVKEGAVKEGVVREGAMREGTAREGEPPLYHDGQRWRPLAVREERIRVRGGEDVNLSVWSTPHGPLVNTLLSEKRGWLSLAWNGARAEKAFAGLLRAMSAANVAEFRSALAEHHEPVLVFVFADTDGAAGRQVAGWVPQRKLPSSLVPVPGRSRLFRWHGRVPFDALPHSSLSDTRNWLVAADQALFAPQAFVETLWQTGERAAHIGARLSAVSQQSLLDLHALAEIQRDSEANGAQSLVEKILAISDMGGSLDHGAEEIARILRAWNRRASIESIGAAVYHVCSERLLRRFFAEWLSADLLDRYLRLPQARPAYVVERVLAALGVEEVGSGIPSEGVPRALVELVRASLRDTWLWFSVHRGANRERWAWGRLHRLRFRPFLEAAAESVWIEALGDYPYPGDSTSVNSGDFAPGHSFAVRLASVFRFLVDLGEPSMVLTALAPGQSEHPGHPHYADELEPWLAGRVQALPMSPLWVEQVAESRLRLEPRP